MPMNLTSLGGISQEIPKKTLHNSHSRNSTTPQTFTPAMKNKIVIPDGEKIEHAWKGYGLNM